MNKTKIIANYLPQFHEIPENNRFWGKGYTDWVAVKKARPLFENHMQPRVPEFGYYKLDNRETIEWQANLARKNGIYGFGIYHYWFSSDLKLLEKPAEILLDAPDIDINYMFIWDNGSWKRTWSNVKRGNDWAPTFDSSEQVKSNNMEDNGMLAELKYGSEEDWKVHFEYLYRFFKDDRYIKKDNRPVFAFFQPDNDYKTVMEMCKYWDKLAKKNGFEGMCFISKNNYQGANLEYKFRYEPLSVNNTWELFISRLQNVKNRYIPKLRIYDYDKVWKKIIKNAKNCTDMNQFFGGFVGFDDTPRRGKKAKIILGQSPEKFEYYMKKLYKISNEQGKEYLFLTAWNEWGEGAYLEPDENYGNQYLNVIKRITDE